MPQTLAQLVRSKYPGAYDDLSDQQLESMVRQKYPGAYDDLPSTLAKPDGALKTQGQPVPGASFSEKVSNAAKMLQSGAQQAGEAVGNVGIGALKGAAHTAIDLGQSVGSLPGIGDATTAIGNAIGGAAGKVLYGHAAAPLSAEQAAQGAREATAYKGMAQRVGGALETGAEMAVPIGEAADALPSTVRAGKNFEAVKAAAKSIPINTQEPGNVALRIADLAQRGGGTNWGPAPVRQFIQWATDPNKPPMTYEQARDFASNISRLSTNEFTRMTPVIQREVANLRVALNKAVADAAGQAGKGQEYAQAMGEYARAMKLRDTVSSAWDAAKRMAPQLTAYGAADYALHRITRALGGE